MGWTSVRLCFLALSVAIVTDVQARLVRNHVSSVCSTWGRENFKTFDGDMFQFPAMCEYNLASDCHETYQEFSVHMRRTEDNGNLTVSYVVVTINDLSFRLRKHQVTVNSQPVKLPYYNAGVQVEQNSVYIKLQSKVGITVMWNRDDAVMVELDRDYANRTCGLCGDFNGVSVYNEFIHNGRRISPIEFGNKHKVHLPNDDCEDPYEEDESREARDVQDSCKEFLTTCDRMFHSESWSSCTKLIDPEPYIRACMQDMCGCTSTTNDLCICSTLSEFSRQCSHAGGQPPNWRSPQFCAKQCPFSMVYKESDSPCMDTCTHQDTSSLCEDHKMDGCFCPPNTVLDDISLRGCIPKSECQCKHDKIYNSGEVYRQYGEECTCMGGTWACKTLETPATCAVEEGSHVTTFDGKTYTFHGDCYYTLAKVDSKDEAKPTFTILAQLVPCANQEFDTCLKTLKILLNKDRNNVLVFTSDGTVKQNTQTVSLPYHTGDINIFHASSFHILLQTNFGLQIQIQHVPVMQVYISLDQSYREKTRGLCGNYNMVFSDDMMTPQGIVEGTAVTFSNSWKVDLRCSDREERLDDPCSFSMENAQYAEHWCALLQSPKSTFAQCHLLVDPELYYKRCMYASCNCEKSEACLCAVFSSYARACASKGVFLTNWRENVCDKYTKSCPASQTFSYNNQRCQLTCRSLGLNQQSCTSDFLPVDGCSCSEGSYLNENGICVPMAKCPCHHNEVYIKPGKSINIKDEHCVCTNGMLHCRSWRPRLSTCPSPKVYLNCSTMGAGELGVQCARTCLNLDSDDCDPTECESGCQCPVGLFDDGKGSCVKENECPCQYNRHLYAPGSEISLQCNKCTCKSGKWECTKKTCSGTCIIYGSGHYETFDQRTYGFQGECSYVAVKNKCGNKTVQENFSVITENVLCGSTGTTCSKTVRIQLGRTEIKLSKGKNETVELENGPQIRYKIRKVGLYLVVESAIGVAVMWDFKTSVRILLEPHHRGEVCGLCGNFDGDGQNDFTTQGQLVVSNPLEFANSWKAYSHCPDTETNVDACQTTPKRHQWAKIMCSIITGKTFKDCHSKVDPLPYYDNCVKDSCACDTGGDCECFCTAVAAYAQACNENGACVAWRTPDICPVFCEYYNNPDECKWHYHPCHTPCYKTCYNPKGICSNPIPSLEGCYPKCPEDKPIFDEEKQICVEECDGCFYNGTRYKENEVIYNVTDNMGMCYYAICINATVIKENETCEPSPDSTTTPTEPTTISTTTSTETPTTPKEPTTPHTTTHGPTTITTQLSTSPATPTVTTPCINPCNWTDWYDVHNAGKDGSDWETYDNIINNGKEICKNPKEIDCRSTRKPNLSFDDFVSQTGQVVTCDVEDGLICRKEDQVKIPYKCFNYEIRVCCEIEECTSTPATSTKPPTVPTTTPKEPTTTTEATTPYIDTSQTTAKPTTVTISTKPPTTPVVTTEEPTTATKTTKPPSVPTTTPKIPTTTTEATTPYIDTSRTTAEPTTVTISTKPPPTPVVTTEETTTATKTTKPPTVPTTTPEEPTTTTEATTPYIDTSRTTAKTTTVTISTKPPPIPVVTTEETTTATKTTKPPSVPTTTPKIPTTTTEATTPYIDTSQTTAKPTTVTISTKPPTTPVVTTEESTTATKTTKPPSVPTTTPKIPTTTTEATTPYIDTSRTTAKPTTVTISTKPPPTPVVTTEEPTTATKTTKPPSVPTTTPKIPTTTTEATTPYIDTSRTTAKPTTVTISTKPPPTPVVTTEEPTTATKTTKPPTKTPTTPKEPTKNTATRTTPHTTTHGPTTITTQLSTSPATPTVTTPCINPCNWTDWYDVHNAGKDGSDWETYDNIINNGKEICKNPKEIDCRSTRKPNLSFDDFVSQTGQVVTCDVEDGLICRKEDQVKIPYKCFNYEIRVCCEIEECTSTPATSTKPPTVPTTTPKEPTTTTEATTPYIDTSRTTAEPTTVKISTKPPPTPVVTTEETTTATKTTKPPTVPTTIPEEPTTTTEATTPYIDTSRTTAKTTTVKISTKPPPTPVVTTEETTTATKTTKPPTVPTTIPEEPTTTTEATTPYIDTSRTTAKTTTVKISTKPPPTPVVTTEETTTATKTTKPQTVPTTTPKIPTTTTEATTPYIDTSRTTAKTTTVKISTKPPPTPVVTTEETTTATKTTKPPTVPTTTPEEPTTTTEATTPYIDTSRTTAKPTTVTISTKPPPTPVVTTEEPTTATKTTKPPSVPTTTSGEPTTTTEATTPYIDTSQTTAKPTTVKISTKPPPTPVVTTEETTTATKTTKPSTVPTTTPGEPTTTTEATTPYIDTSRTTAKTTTVAISTKPPPTPVVTTEETTTATKTTKPPTVPTTIPEEPTTTTEATTPYIDTSRTTAKPTTVKISTKSPPTPVVTTEETTTATKTTKPPSVPTTTPGEPTTTTEATTPYIDTSRTTAKPTTVKISTKSPPTPVVTTEETTTATKTTKPPSVPTTTPGEPTTTTEATTPYIDTSRTTAKPTTVKISTKSPPTPVVTTEETTTATKTTKPPSVPTTTPGEPTTTTEATTPYIDTSRTTAKPTTVKISTKSPPTPVVTTEETTTATKTTKPPSVPTTTPGEPTTTTEATTPYIDTSRTTANPTTVTISTKPPPTPVVTTKEPTTATKTTKPPTVPTTTPGEPTTTTEATTPYIDTSRTTAKPTTVKISTKSPPTPVVTTEETTTATKTTKPPSVPTTTPGEPTTTTEATTPYIDTSRTTANPTTVTISTKPPPTPVVTTKEPTTATKTTKPPTVPTTTPGEPTTTTEATTPYIGTSRTTAKPTTVTISTKPPPTPVVTTEEPTTTTKFTKPPSTTFSTTFAPPITHSPPSLTVNTAPVVSLHSTLSSKTTLTTTTPSSTTQCVCVFNGNQYKPEDVIFDRKYIGAGLCLTMICSAICEIENKTEVCATTMPTLAPTTIPTVPTCPQWNVTQNETFYLCNCTMAICIENNTIEVIPYECPPLKNITCINGKKPVLAWDEYLCCQQYVCDCVCEGWGDPHYITFDGLFYSYQGNCTYILMEEIQSKHDLKIYIDNVNCDPTEDVSCPRSLIISYKSRAITLKNHNLIGAAELEALIGDTPLKLPYSKHGVKILDSGINLVFEIPHLKVIITFGITGFSVTLPFRDFGENTQGHCGTCNNNTADDCMLPGGQLVESCAVMADYWLANDIHQPNCKVPSVVPTKIPEPAPTITTCKPDGVCDLLHSSVFAECHPFVSPDNFYKGCIFDSCHVSNPVVECTSLQTYAAACAQAGVCLHWRNHTTLCANDCPADKVYSPCGPVEQPTCEDNPNDATLNFTTEGCFCPEGKKLFNKDSGICVDKCGCLDPERIPREFGEQFEYKCQNCICQESTKTVTCKPKVCPAPPTVNCTGPGFVLVEQTNPSDSCCSAYACKCESNTCPTIDTNCPAGYRPVVSVPEGKCCPKLTCEIKRVCVHDGTEYETGSLVPSVHVCQDCSCSNEVDPKSGHFRVKCVFKQCEELCDTGYKYMKLRKDQCCGSCVQTHCILRINGTKIFLKQGETWPPGNKCEFYTCVKTDQSFSVISSNVVCPPFQESNCQPDTVQTAANGCCKTCVEKGKGCRLLPNKTHIMHNKCQSDEVVDVPYCEGSCSTFTKYSEKAAALQSSCSCCRETRFSQRTINLRCMNGDMVPHTYMHVEECGCGQTTCTIPSGPSSRRKRSFTLQ